MVLLSLKKLFMKWTHNRDLAILYRQLPIYIEKLTDDELLLAINEGLAQLGADPISDQEAPDISRRERSDMIWALMVDTNFCEADETFRIDRAGKWKIKIDLT